MPSRATAPIRAAFRQLRGEEPFVLQTVERGVNGTGGNGSSIDGGLHFAQDRSSVCVISQTDDSQQYDLLKGAQQSSHVYNVDISGLAVKRQYAQARRKLFDQL